MPDSKQITEIKQDIATSVCIGNFDGCHLGHQKLLQTALEIAKDRGLRPFALTFDPHPNNYFSRNQSSIPLIFSAQQKKLAFKELGIEGYFLKFNQEIALMSPECFFKNILVDKLQAKAIIVGENFRFGFQRKGTTQSLKELGQKHDIEIIVLDFERSNTQEEVISSSVVRLLIERDGAIEKANTYLGRPYKIEGTVVRGNQLGRKIGYPTANLNLSNLLIPANGVYCGYAIVNNAKYSTPVMTLPKDSKPFVMNIGYRPTIGGKEKLHVELHFFTETFPEDKLYEQEISIYVTNRIRNEIKFETINDLKNQIKLDIAKAGQILK